MFVDELEIIAKAGHGGDGVVRWRQEKFKPKAGPAGGNGGNGGDVFVRGVKDLNRLAKYTGNNEFEAENGVSGTNSSQHGRNGEDFIIDIPVGSRVTDIERRRMFEINKEGEVVKILKGGSGGLGNEHFKSSTNTSPTESTKGRHGEAGRFLIEVSLVVDVGFIGFPNAGKSTLLNALTNAHSKIGAYPFTTLEPHLGDMYGFILADIPGLIEGAAGGKGLGHKFLRHVARTNMLLHVIALTDDDVESSYYTIRNELEKFDPELLKKEEWIVLTKKDLILEDELEGKVNALAKINNRVLVCCQDDAESYKILRDSLVTHLRSTYNSTIVT